MTFASLPVSNRHARRFLREFLDGNGLGGDFADSAELALSEVVTNAVLHAHTEFEVALHVDDGVLRVEVTDQCFDLPGKRRYADQATTGRGMDLIAAYASDCGVDAGPEGKTVWFVVDRPSPGDEPSGQELLNPWVLDVDSADGTRGEGRVVVLLSLPLLLWLAACEHQDAVLRELALYVAARHEDAPGPDRIALADKARAWMSTKVVAESDRLSASAKIDLQGLSEGHPDPQSDVPASLDLEVPVPGGATEAFAALQDVLDVAESLAGCGLLLARPGLPEVVAVRDWACEQVISQRSGVRPKPWPGTEQERFTLVPDGHHPTSPAWDSRLVSDSGCGAVAVDDANRIIAVSRPLADALGWEVDDLVGRRLVVLIPPELREAHVAGFTRHLTTGQTRVVGVPRRLPVLRADGSRVDYGFLIEQVPATMGRTVYVAWIDPDQ